MALKDSWLISGYEKLEALVNKLPGSLQKPILHEIRPVKNLFLMQHPPRIAIVGDLGASKADFVNTLFEQACTDCFAPSRAADGGGAWETYVVPSRGTIEVLDARQSAQFPSIRRAMETEAPDLFVFLSNGPMSADEADNALRALNVPRIDGFSPRMIAVRSGKDANDTERLMLHGKLHDHAVGERLAGTFLLLPDSPQLFETAAMAITRALPEEARLEMARICRVKTVQAEIAQTLTKSMTAICSAVGAQPIPLADFPILTALQAGMVSGIMYISGREMSKKLAVEFIGAVGANVGAALVLREGSRAALKFLPFWGNAVSGAVAGAGTYALGRAATAYFIEGIPLPDARRLFKKKKQDQPPALLE